MRMKFLNIGWKTKWPEITSNTAILWEPCSDSHGEIVPGYAKYLVDLGYQVLVLLTPKRLGEGLFSRFNHEKLEFATLSQRQIKQFMVSGMANQAALVMISTVGKLPHSKEGEPDLDYVFGPNLPKNLLLVEHDAKSKIDHQTWRSDYMTLATLNYKNNHSIVVNPHYFGPVAKKKKANEKTNFVIVGAARGKRRNTSMLFDALEKLIKNGHRNFKLKMIGKTDRTAIPSAIAEHVDILGRLDFCDLYRQIDMADFLVTAFEKNNPDHALYRTVKTSGSIQLSYGFHTPIIIQKGFELVTSLDEQNSIMYDENSDLYDALLRAIQISTSDYDVMTKTLAADANDLYQSSLKNLDQLIHE